MIEDIDDLGRGTLGTACLIVTQRTKGTKQKEMRSCMVRVTLAILILYVFFSTAQDCSCTMVWYSLVMLAASSEIRRASRESAWLPCCARHGLQRLTMTGVIFFSRLWRMINTSSCPCQGHLPLKCVPFQGHSAGSPVTELRVSHSAFSPCSGVP